MTELSNFLKSVERGVGRRPSANASQEDIERYNRILADELAMLNVAGAIEFLHNFKKQQNENKSKTNFGK